MIAGTDDCAERDLNEYSDLQYNIRRVEAIEM